MTSADRPDRPIDRDTIASTHDIIRPYVRVTPTIQLNGTELGLSRFPITLKLELMQHAGSFKTRGAFANLLLRRVPPAGVAAASGGNHGAAVAYAAMRLGHKAHIFVPGISSPAKIARIRGYGAELSIVGERYDDALKASERYVAASGALAVHAFDQPETLLGQGTLAAELDTQLAASPAGAGRPDGPGGSGGPGHIDTLLVAVGGGGLIGGIAAWYAGRVRVIGVEPTGAPTLTDAIKAGHPVDAPAGSIAADSLAPRQIGRLAFAIAQSFVERTVLVTDDDIRQAQRTLWETLRVIAEPGGAAAFAAVLSGAYAVQPGERVGVVVSGGNTTIAFQ